MTGLQALEKLREHNKSGDKETYFKAIESELIKLDNLKKWVEENHSKENVVSARGLLDIVCYDELKEQLDK